MTTGSRWFLFTGVVASIGCATVLGVDEDYREVDPSASGSAGAGASGGTAGGSGGAGGASGLGAAGGASGAAAGGSAGIAGTAGVGGLSGAAGAGGTGGTGGTGGSAGSGGGPGCSSTGSACVSEAPAGWNGPIVLHESSSTPPACPTQFPTELTPGALLYGDLSTPASSCSCGCTPPASPSCGSATLRTHSQASCGDLGSVVNPVLTSGTCANISDVTNARVRATASLGGSCAVQSNHSIPPPTWGTTARACSGAPQVGSCDTGEVCLPAPPPGWKACVYKSGATSCPAAGYTEAHVLYDGATDSRQCSACSCGSITGTCNGSVGFSNSSSCTTATIVLGIGDCTTGVTGAFAKYTHYAPTNVSCPPSSSSLSGSVTPTNPTTVCCTP